MRYCKVNGNRKIFKYFRKKFYEEKISKDYYNGKVIGIKQFKKYL